MHVSYRRFPPPSFREKVGHGRKISDRSETRGRRESSHDVQLQTSAISGNTNESARLCLEICNGWKASCIPAGRLIHAMPEASQEELNAWFNDFKLSVDKIHRPCVGRKEEKFGRLGARDHPEGWVQRRERKECLRLKNKIFTSSHTHPPHSFAVLPARTAGWEAGGRGGERGRAGGLKRRTTERVITKRCAGRPL
jgi:hypothetical protein